MLKVIRDGMVAVLYSPGYGAGWYTWNSKYPTLIFHPLIVEMVENGKELEITTEWIEKNINISGISPWGVEGLEIKWLPVGTRFIIKEYDGSESIQLLDDIDFITA
jgi:hypothetical protein